MISLTLVNFTSSAVSPSRMQIEDSVIAHFLFGCNVGNLASVRRNLDPAELSNTKDESGNTGLVMAAQGGHLEIIQ